MKREIKFRGKYKRTGEWIFGLLFKGVGCSLGVDKIAYYVGDCFDFYEEVIPETVGQYTGIRHKETEEELYEGDIIQVILKGEIILTKPIIEDYGAWGVDVDFDGIVCPLHDYITSKEGYILKCIGNIHDNPELLTPIINNQ